ncbi:hypothetical protein B9Z55_005599 [Caenorhabditis nigoni]|uniref:Uncharacterized protein n=1 Tax=Caenorhabditis nigoni TaxID=1611254 RepID=A0A2G5V1W2_9PELO|nr:hypothetical protein B9Z55_005599 [Caenorhabditis nigoni]
MDEKKQKKLNKNSKKPDVPHSFYFYLVLRFLAARCLFSFVYALSILIAAVMFLIANDGCDPRMISQFGCYQSVSTGTFQVSSAFCFLILVFGLLDLGLNAFYFWRNSKRSPIYDYPPPSVAVVETEKTIHDIYMEYQRKGQTTSV